MGKKQPLKKNHYLKMVKFSHKNLEKNISMGKRIFQNNLYLLFILDR